MDLRCRLGEELEKSKKWDRLPACLFRQTGWKPIPLSQTAAEGGATLGLITDGDGYLEQWRGDEFAGQP